MYSCSSVSVYFSSRPPLAIFLLSMLGLAVALPMFISSPGFSNWSQTALHTNLTACYPPNDEKSRGFSIYAAFLAFISPFTVLILLYLAIALKMRSISKLKLLRLNTKVGLT